MRSSMTLELKQLQRCQHHTKEPHSYIYHLNLEIQMQSFETQNCFITKHIQKFPPQTMIEHVTCSMGGGLKQRFVVIMCNHMSCFLTLRLVFQKERDFEPQCCMSICRTKPHRCSEL